MTHTWEETGATRKQPVGGRLYVPCACTECGITGKQYHGDSDVTLDHAYRYAAVFKSCASTQAHLELKRQRVR